MKEKIEAGHIKWQKIPYGKVKGKIQTGGKITVHMTNYYHP